MIFNEKYKYLKNTHYQILEYLLIWIFGKKPPKSIVINNQSYYWFSLQKIADDNYKSYFQVKTALRRLEGKDKSINYSNDEPFVYAQMIYSRTETNKLYLRLNYKKIVEILDEEKNQKLISKIRNEEACMPALFDADIEKKKYSKNAQEIVCDIINNNSDLFKTKISKSKTFKKCCIAVQDIYDGRFTNQHLYDISKNINTNQFDYDGWKEKINSVKNNWLKIKELIKKAIGNYRLMFIKKNMPSNKKYLPDSLDKWFFDELNNNGYPSYFVFSLRKPKPQKVQYADNNAQEIFKELPTKIQDIGNEIINNYVINNDYTLWKNLKGMYGWCKWLIGSDINQNVGYWVSSPAEIITKFVDYCDANNILMNEYTFNVQNALNNNAPFAWFISNAINEHKLNKEILKSCA